MVIRALVVLAVAIGVSEPWAASADFSQALAEVLLTTLVTGVGWLATAGLLGLLGRLSGWLGRVGRVGVAVLLPPAARVGAVTLLGLQATAGVAAASPSESPVVGRPLTSLSATPLTVVVAPGDTLWDLARRHLGPEASDAAVAVAWPRWWEANRATIGDDPDLLRVGLKLVVPGGGPR